MSRLIALTATALALTLAAPAAVIADPGNGKGADKQERGNRGGDDDRGNRGNGNGNGNDDRGNGRGADRSDDRRAERPETRVIEAVRGRGDERELRRTVEREVFQTRDGRPVVYFQRDRDRGLIAGCPPGLAKKDNGCLPPGQARQIARAAGADRYDWLWRTRGDDSRYRYADGYLYRMNPQGSLLGYLPVLGGALAPGAIWPAQYAYQPAPDYYSRYFGLPQGQDYRYADGALYGVNPQTQVISQVAALLTGQNLGVGQPLPGGYDVYNVPYAQRAQYADNANSIYRYNDGYVYQADPKTQLVTAVIQLLT
ncbi:MAG: hypothetical protein Q8R45_14840 [Brevundimonas sp.]|uniref:hypothetical protein n=1 Tax=Brevundimonas sp. TaxID=1871086 RepID=UPI002737620D|nr:hypothetical protein [Brevundimonas sp.]MDP3658227.1 hypothetical protein [Brevundimonas sp.]MDZ4108036.1 hypothetical protein [Brevundimonas sp.]